MLKTMRFCENLQCAALYCCFLGLAASALSRCYKENAPAVDGVQKGIRALRALMRQSQKLISAYGAILNPRKKGFTPEALNDLIKAEAAFSRRILSVLALFEIVDFLDFQKRAQTRLKKNFERLPDVTQRETIFFADLNDFLKSRGVENFFELKERSRAK